MEIGDKFLPLGTVVMLKKGVHRAMIIGYMVRLDTASNDKYYDYMGCLFPEGVFSTEQSFAFDHSDIKKVYHNGLSDDESKEFLSKLKNFINR